MKKLRNLAFMVIPLLSWATLNTAEASSSSSVEGFSLIPVAIHATQSADYSSDLHVESIAPMNLSIMYSIFADIQLDQAMQTGAFQSLESHTIEEDESDDRSSGSQEEPSSVQPSNNASPTGASNGLGTSKSNGIENGNNNGKNGNAGGNNQNKKEKNRNKSGLLLDLINPLS